MELLTFGVLVLVALLWYWAYTYDKEMTELLTDMGAAIDKLRKEVNELKGVKEDDGK